MSGTTLTFFNNKGGVGKTSLVYHVASMLSELDHVVLAVDLDPQANLTAAFLNEDDLVDLWEGSPQAATTIHRCVEPLSKVGDIRRPLLRRVSDRLYLLPGDLALSDFEDLLSKEWPDCLGSAPYRAFRAITSFWQVIRMGMEEAEADIVLVDVGPSLGAINRSALIATDFVVVPLGADLFSLQGLRNLGPALRRWRSEWTMRRDHWQSPEFELPVGDMRPIGYLMQQHGVRLSRPVRAYDRWFRAHARRIRRERSGRGAGDGRCHTRERPKSRCDHQALPQPDRALAGGSQADLLPNARRWRDGGALRGRERRIRRLQAAGGRAVAADATGRLKPSAQHGRCLGDLVRPDKVTRYLPLVVTRNGLPRRRGCDNQGGRSRRFECGNCSRLLSDVTISVGTGLP